MNKVLTVGLLLLTAVSACTQSGSPALAKVVVYKNESCGCCKLWVQHLEANGFDVRVSDVDNLETIKQRVGIPVGKGACHTAVVDGYFVEGHVPAEDVKQLLETRPDALGLTAPGMPVGSPGMKQGELHPRYDVLLIDRAGNTSVFAQHGG